MPCYGYHVGVPTEDDTAINGRTDARVETALGGACWIGHAVTAYAKTRQVVLEVSNDFQVGVASQDGKGNEIAE